MTLTHKNDSSMTRNAAVSEAPSRPPSLRHQSRKLTMPWTEAQEIALQECQAILTRTELSFVEKGQALKRIRDECLYRKNGYRSFSTFCVGEYGLPRRTVRQCIDDADNAIIVHNCAQCNPRHASQMRHLAKLDSDADKQAAWQHAVQQAIENNGIPAEAQVKAAVAMVKAKKDGTSWTAQLMPDRMFLGITRRWELSAVHVQTRTVDSVILTHLPSITADSGASAVTTPKDCPLVLVSPDREYLTPTLGRQSLQQLITVCGSTPTFCFLLWTRSPEVFQEIPTLPGNVSVAYRVSQQADLDMVPSHLSGSCPLDTLWLDPEKPLRLATLPTRITRVLIGNPAWIDRRISDDVRMMRQLISSCLGHAPSVAVHLASSILPILFNLY